MTEVSQESIGGNEAGGSPPPSPSHPLVHSTSCTPTIDLPFITVGGQDSRLVS